MLIKELPQLGSLRKVGNFERRGRKWIYQPITSPRRKLRVCMIEPGEEENRGSIGCVFVLNAAREAGFTIDYLQPDSPATGYDVELISIHHCTDFIPLSRLPRRSPIRIVGGHPTVNNIRPAIPFGDVFCIGEGEEWVAWVLDALSRGATVEDLAEFPGTLVSKLHSKGDPIPKSLTVSPLPQHPPYLNRPGNGHAATWYIEMSRGCPFACHYCELGHAWKYRNADTGYLLSQIDAVDRRQSRKVTLFAPDEASHPGYASALQRLSDRKLTTSFGSMRLDQIIKKDLPFPRNMLIRVGVDGLTERTRFRVGRKQTDSDIINYFEYMIRRGYYQFKMFMVFCYPWETEQDFSEWSHMMRRLQRIKLDRNVHCRIKFTPLIPQPSTPLGVEQPSYNFELVERAKQWFLANKRSTDPGWTFVNDGIMGHKAHSIQCALTQGDEDALQSIGDSSGYSTLAGYRVW